MGERLADEARPRLLVSRSDGRPLAEATTGRSERMRALRSNESVDAIGGEFHEKVARASVERGEERTVHPQTR